MKPAIYKELQRQMIGLVQARGDGRPHTVRSLSMTLRIHQRDIIHAANNTRELILITGLGKDDNYDSYRPYEYKIVPSGWDPPPVGIGPYITPKQKLHVSPDPVNPARKEIKKLWEEIDEWIRKGSPLMGIKIYRDWTGESLRDSKYAIDCRIKELDL